jgi:hypothetical protein
MVAAPAEGRKRPRGFIRAWEPRPATRQLLGEVQRVLDEYRAHLPLTVRQIYYRLVATGKLEKTERAYGRLVEHLTLARRAEFVAFEHIRDDGADLPGSLVGWSDPGDLAGLLAAVARDFALDPQTGQARRLLLWCEAGGMRPQLERVAAPYGVQVVAGGGFDSLTAKHAMAELMTDADAAFEVLHVGDFDPSGEHVFASLAEDVEEFALALGADVAFARLAVTPAQVDLYGLPTAPPKPSDRRSFSGGDRTVQAEALPPDVLADIVEAAIRERLDLGLVAEAGRLSGQIRADAEARLRASGLWP